MKKIAVICAKIEWINFWFITLTPIVGIIGTVWAIQSAGFVWPTWALMVVYMFITGIGITAGYHRLFSHLSYSAHPIVGLILLLAGGAAFEGSVREWCCAHRKHHKHVDHEQDPYNVQKGFWWSHVGWVVTKADQSDESNIKDLVKNRYVMWQSRYYIPLAFFFGIALPTVICGTLWGDWIGGFFIAGILRIVVNHHLTFFINSFCHMFGRRNYSDKDSSKDCWWLAYLTYGEGYHNYHHTFQWDYRNGVRIYHFDPAKWLVYLLSKVNLTWDLKRVDESKILGARLAMDEKKLYDHRFRQWIVERYPKVAAYDWTQLVGNVRTNVEQMHARLLELRREYRRLKSQKQAQMRRQLDDIQKEIFQTRREFQRAITQWKLLLRGEVVALPLV